MLAQMAGVTTGVAKAVTPLLYNYDYLDGNQWVIDALDMIWHDFNFRRATAGLSGGLTSGLAPLAVLSMSFGY